MSGKKQYRLLMIDDDAALNNSFINSPISLRPMSIRLPPRLFDSPTGDILPSLAIHAGAGLGFGFSDEQERTRRWVVSFGLGGAGEEHDPNLTHEALGRLIDRFEKIARREGVTRTCEFNSTYTGTFDLYMKHLRAWYVAQ